MNPMKVNFKAAKYYLEALEMTMGNILIELKEFKTEEWRNLYPNEQDFQRSFAFFYYQNRVILEFFRIQKEQFKIDPFTEEESQLLDWFYKQIAESIAKDNPELEQDPWIIKKRFSFVDKKQ